MRKVTNYLFDRKIDIGEYHNSTSRLFQNLRAPTCLLTCIETLAALEPQQLKTLNQ